MTWFKVDDGFYDHPDVEMLPDAAIAMWTRAGSYCGKHLTDGVLAGRVARRFADDPDKAITALVVSGLWEALNEAGDIITGAITGASRYRFCNWHKYQPTKEAATLARDKKAEAARAGNHDRWHIDKGKYSQDCAYCVAGSGRTQPHPSDRESDRSSDSPSDRSLKSSRPTRPITTSTSTSSPKPSTNLRSTSVDVLPGLDDEQPRTDNRTAGQRLVGHWLDQITPMRPNRNSVKAVGKLLSESATSGNVPEDLLQECIEEFVASGKSGVNVLRGIIESRIHRAAGPTNRRKHPDCPLHFGSVSGNCAQCEYEHGDPAYGKNQPEE